MIQIKHINEINTEEESEGNQNGITEPKLFFFIEMFIYRVIKNINEKQT